MRRPQPQLCQQPRPSASPCRAGQEVLRGCPAAPPGWGFSFPTWQTSPSLAMLLCLLVVLKPNWDADRESTAARMPLWPYCEATQPCGTASTLRVQLCCSRGQREMLAGFTLPSVMGTR